MHNIFKSKCIQREQTFIQEHISNIHRDTTPVMKLNQGFLLLIQSVHGCFPQVLCLLFFSECLIISGVMLQCTKEGAYIPFSLSNSTTIKSTINFLSNNIKSNKCLSYLRTRAYLLKVPFTIYKVRFINFLHECLAQLYQGVSKFCAGAIQLSFLLHALACLMSERCSCITLLGSLPSPGLTPCLPHSPRRNPRRIFNS
jgi:hypothetical protein